MKIEKINDRKPGVNLLDKFENFKISVMIPAHNEEKSIKQCIEAVLAQSRRADQIVIINDGSTDRTGKILDEFGDSITHVELAKCTGTKSYAQEHGLRYVEGDIFITTDADTILSRDFIANVIQDFKSREVAAVCGYVKSMKYNWLTACREIDYILGQTIHKNAQSYMNFLLVIPGCAAAYRTDIFSKHVSFDHDTVAEDLDFTYKLNEQNFKIKFNKNAIVYTQDPAELKTYIRQMERWYRGNWQNLKKHFKIMSRPISALELSMAYVEGIVFPIMLITLPIISLVFFGQFLILLFTISSLLALYASFAGKRYELVLYSPFYLFIILLNSLLFLKEFGQEIIFSKNDFTWHQPARREI